ncbi:MAG: hypothetical protein WA324_22315 [Bryobacteraceae bacterium]
MKEAMYWTMLAGSVLDTLLLVRVLGLRLQRIYAFITLDCLLSACLDWFSMYLGWDSRESFRVFAFTRFLYAALTPLIAWDVFEEVKLESAKIRRPEAARMVISLLVTAFLWVVLSVGLLFGDSSQAVDWPEATGPILWYAACLFGMFFIWRTRRGLMKQGTNLPRNTTVWSLYYLLTWGCSMLGIVPELFNLKVNGDIFNMASNGWLMACTIFCLFRLRGAPAEVATVSRD